MEKITSILFNNTLVILKFIYHLLCLYREISAAARQLSLYESKIYGWRKAVKKYAKISDRELATENAKLKRLLAEQAEELPRYIINNSIFEVFICIHLK